MLVASSRVAILPDTQFFMGISSPSLGWHNRTCQGLPPPYDAANGRDLQAVRPDCATRFSTASIRSSLYESGAERHRTWSVADAEDERAALEHEPVHFKNRDPVGVGQLHEQLRSIRRE